MMKIKVSFLALMGLFLLHLSSIPVYADGTEKINIPDGFVTPDTQITVTTAEGENKTLKSVRVRSKSEPFKDITSKKYFKTGGPGDVEVEIVYTDKDGNDETKTLTGKIDKFDGDKPTVNASLLGDILTIKAEDQTSGVYIININGKDYTDLTDDSCGVNIKELEHDSEFLTIYAKDKAGNVSATYKVKNPYYVGEKTENKQDQSTENPQSTEPTPPTSSEATITSHTDEEGRDLSKPIVEQPKVDKASSEASSTTTESATVSNKKAGGKEFYTIKTDSDKIFYLVVDETDTNESAYLLTEVNENDLLNFVNYDGTKVDNGEITVYSIAEDKPEVATEEPEEVEEEEPKEKTLPKSSSSVGLIVIVVLGVAAFYVIKKKKDGNNADDSDDDDEFEDDGDLESVTFEDEEQ